MTEPNRQDQTTEKTRRRRIPRRIIAATGITALALVWLGNSDRKPPTVPFEAKEPPVKHQPLSHAAAFMLRAKAPSRKNTLESELPLVNCDLTYDRQDKKWVPLSVRHDRYVSPKQPLLFGLTRKDNPEFEAAASLADPDGTPGEDIGIDSLDVRVTGKFAHLHFKPDVQTGYKLPKPTTVSVPLKTDVPVLGHYDTVIYDVVKNSAGQVGLALACDPAIVHRENKHGT